MSMFFMSFLISETKIHRDFLSANTEVVQCTKTSKQAEACVSGCVIARYDSVQMLIWFIRRVSKLQHNLNKTVLHPEPPDISQRNQNRTELCKLIQVKSGFLFQTNAIRVVVLATETTAPYLSVSPHTDCREFLTVEM